MTPPRDDCPFCAPDEACAVHQEAVGEPLAGAADPPSPPALALVPTAGETSPDEDEPSREEMLEAVPLSLTIWHEVDLDAPDPSVYTTDAGVSTRRCIGERKAGGRCTVRAMGGSLCCPVHAGILDPSAGGHALARRRREARGSEEERARLARLGTRGVVAEALARKAVQLGQAIEVLADAAAAGDRQAALALIPWLNQGLGMPTERLQVQAPESGADLAAMSTADLQALVAARRARTA